jgi:NADH dehydrogenase FAD-containing subunit
MILLEVSERHQRRGVAVGGGAAHVELVGELGDAQHRLLGTETVEDREAGLQRG